MADELQLTLSVPYPSRSGSAAKASGGSFPAGTYSFCSASWYSSGEADIDFAGRSLDSADYWNGVSVTLNQKVTLTISRPDRVPDHISIYVQSAASFDPASAADEVAVTFTVIDENTIEAEILSPSLSGTAQTFGAAYPSVLIHSGNMAGDMRANASKAGTGLIVKRSYAQDLTWERIPLECFTTSFEGSEYRRMLKWAKYALRCELEDLTGAQFISKFYGTLGDFPFLGNEGFWPSPEIPFSLTVESEEEA